MDNKKSEQELTIEFLEKCGIFKEKKNSDETFKYALQKFKEAYKVINLPLGENNNNDVNDSE